MTAPVSIFNLPPAPSKLGRGASRIDRLRHIVAGGSAARVDGTRVDAFTAGAYVAVWDKLTAENRAKLDALPLLKAARVVWKMAKP